MAVDYRDAAERHWSDGAYLLEDEEENRMANADHLFGVSAECALKAIMHGLGMPLQTNGKPIKTQHRVHIDSLWDEFISFSTARGGARYAGTMSSAANPFRDWRIGQRYDRKSDFNRDDVQRHRSAAFRAVVVMQRAVLDGVAI